MEESKKRVILHMMRVLNKLAGSSAEESVKKAALQMIEDLWYQYLVIESLTEDEGMPNAKNDKTGALFKQVVPKMPNGLRDSRPVNTRRVPCWFWTKFKRLRIGRGL